MDGEHVFVFFLGKEDSTLRFTWKFVYVDTSAI